MLDYLIFIGRFQPFHNAHLAVVKQALAQAHSVIILCGSADMARNLRNPWTVAEREDMIRSVFSAQDNARIIIRPIHDVPYNDSAWINNVEQAVNSASHTADASIGIIGHLKDQSSYYLNIFPQWQWLSVANIANINATAIRQQYLRLAPDETLATTHLPPSVHQWLSRFRHSQDYAQLHAEQRYIDDYQRQWQNAPFAPIFVTTDALITHRDSLLLIERKHLPGKGLWALPGGFIERDERLLSSCLRELQEETNLALDNDTLRQALRRRQVYDDPQRSARGRTITHVFHFDLPSNLAPPSINAADDAARAFWQPLNQLPRQQFFEDHYDIINDMLG